MTTLQEEPEGLSDLCAFWADQKYRVVFTVARHRILRSEQEGVQDRDLGLCPRQGAANLDSLQLPA